MFGAGSKKLRFPEKKWKTIFAENALTDEIWAIVKCIVLVFGQTDHHLHPLTLRKIDNAANTNYPKIWKVRNNRLIEKLQLKYDNYIKKTPTFENS